MILYALRPLVSMATKGKLAIFSYEHYTGSIMPTEYLLADKIQVIEALLQNGSKQSFIANRYGATEATLSNWISKNKIQKPTTKSKKMMLLKY